LVWKGKEKTSTVKKKKRKKKKPGNQQVNRGKFRPSMARRKEKGGSDVGAVEPR